MLSRLSAYFALFACVAVFTGTARADEPKPGAKT
jgi:hypothetical protein